MSLMGMRKGLLKFGPFIYVPLILAFVITAFVGLGSYLGGGKASRINNGGADGAVAATVGDLDVSRQALDRQVQQQLQQRRQYMPGSPEPSALELATMPMNYLNQVRQQQALIAAAKKEGIRVADTDVAKERDRVWEQQRPQIIQALGLPEKATDPEIEAALRQQSPNLSIAVFKQQLPEDQLRGSLYAQKLQEKLKAEVQKSVTPDQVKRSYSDIQVRHILIASGPQGGLPDEQAKAKAEKLLAAVKADPAQMPKLAQENTDDPGSKTKGGLYDWAPAGQYVSAFTNAALAVKPGEVYPDVVKTPFGYHIIKLEGIRDGKSLPKDFAKDTQKYTDQYADRLVQEKMQEKVDAALPGVEIKVTDPQLRAAQLQQESLQFLADKDKPKREAKLNEALETLSKADAKNYPAGAIALTRADLYKALGKNGEATAAYQEALASSNNLETRLALAALLVKKDKDAAVKELQTAQEQVRGEVMQQFQIAQLYREAGRKDLADAADKKYVEMMKRQAALNQQQMQEQQQQQATGGTPPPSPPTGNAPGR